MLIRRPDATGIMLFATGFIVSIVGGPLILLYREVRAELAWTPYQRQLVWPMMMLAALILAFGMPILFAALRRWRESATTRHPRWRILLLIVAHAAAISVLTRLVLGLVGILAYLPSHPIPPNEYGSVLWGDSGTWAFIALTVFLWAFPPAVYCLVRHDRASRRTSSIRVADGAI